jgi:dolichol-phosphate mannosyltransferase
VRLAAGAIVRSTATAVVVARLGRIVLARQPVRRAVSPCTTTISVVIPARNEAGRIVPLLGAMIGAPGVSEVIVVDDESTDGTASIAAAAGAGVVSAGGRPSGWAGKSWALQCGLHAASSDWIVTLDADARPDPGLPSAVVARAEVDGTDLLTVAGRFRGHAAGARWLHAAMLTTLVYRFGAPGRSPLPAPHRVLANGQCMAFRRTALLELGGLSPVSGAVVEDVALARHLARAGRRVDFLDASDLLHVELYDSLAATWSGWGRSIGLPGVEPRWRQLVDVVTLTLTLPVPVLRLAVGRVDPIDLVALAARLGTLVGTSRAFARRDLAYWLSPLADAVAIAALIRNLSARRQTWSGRSYDL